MSLRINGIQNLTSANEGYITLGNSLRNKYSRVFKKHIVALSRLAAIANMPETEDLSIVSVTQLLQDRNTSQNTLLVHRKIRNLSFTGLLNTQINTLAHHYKLIISGLLLRRPPLTKTIKSRRLR